jgi:hypothetical protein
MEARRWDGYHTPVNDNAAPSQHTELLTPYLRGNLLFMAVLALLVFVPGLLTFFGPTVLDSVGDVQWMGIGWGIAIILVFIADEVFVPGKENLSTGFRKPGDISHDLVTNPVFILAVILLVLAPPPITYFGPVIFGSSPDWLWLVIGWIVAIGAAFLGYRTMKSEEARVS